MEDNLKKMEDDRNFLENQRRPWFFDTGRWPNFYLSGRQPKTNAIWTNSSAQHRQPDQHNLKKSTLIGCDIIVN